MKIVVVREMPSPGGAKLISEFFPEFEIWPLGKPKLGWRFQRIIALMELRNLSEIERAQLAHLALGLEPNAAIEGIA